MAKFMEVGMEFESFDAFQAAMEQYEDSHFVQFSRIDSRTVEKAQETSLTKTFNPEIKFSQLHYACTFGPKKAMSRSSGIRNATSRKIDCPVRLRLAATPDGQRLVIKESKLDCHNHEVTEEQYQSLSRQKQLDEETENEIYNLISMHEDKRLARMLIRNKLTKETGRTISVKDILNIEKRVSKRLGKDDSSTKDKKDNDDQDEDSKEPNDESSNEKDDTHEDSQEEDGESNQSKTNKSVPKISPSRPQRNRREPRRFRDAIENGEKILHTSKNNVVSILSPDDIDDDESPTFTPSSSKKTNAKVKEEVTTVGRKRKFRASSEDQEVNSKSDFEERKLAIKEELLEMEKKKMKILQEILKKLDKVIENQKKS
nr:mastermind-like protein 2 [Biomphalaria glabrata]